MANEKRLISADVAKEMIVNHANEFSDVLNRREKALLIGGGTSCIDKCPTVDADEVVHARWVPSGGEYVKCTACGDTWNTQKAPVKDFCRCPCCGAYMKGLLFPYVKSRKDVNK